MRDSLDLVVDSSRTGVMLGLYFSESFEVCIELTEPSAKGEGIKALFLQMLELSKYKLENIKRVLTTLGPGSFTGIRAGIAFCEGLCFSGERTLHGVSTLRALATHFPGGTNGLEYPENAMSVLKARTGYYYIGDCNGERLQQLDEPPQTNETLPITPFAKLIPFITPSKIQKANYIMNPYSQ